MTFKLRYLIFIYLHRSNLKLGIKCPSTANTNVLKYCNKFFGSVLIPKAKQSSSANSSHFSYNFTYVNYSYLGYGSQTYICCKSLLHIKQILNFWCICRTAGCLSEILQWWNYETSRRTAGIPRSIKGPICIAKKQKEN